MTWDQFSNLDEEDSRNHRLRVVAASGYSARLQTIDARIHPDFHRLISEFKKITGVPIVINTSFNVSGQPIVRTGKEAWECFLNTDIDILVVNDSAFRNPFERTRQEKLEWLKQFASAA